MDGEQNATPQSPKQPARMTRTQAVLVRDAIKADPRSKEWFVTVDDIDGEKSSILLRTHAGDTHAMENIAHEIAESVLETAVSKYDISAKILPRPNSRTGEQHIVR